MTRLENYVGNELRSFDVQLIYEPATSGTKRRTASALSFLVIFNVLVIPTPNGGGICDGTPRGKRYQLYIMARSSALGMKDSARVLVGAWWDSSS